MTTVTAIIPVYNVKQYLSRCLDSVLAQTVPFDRIVLVNDGSTDGCKEICNSYAKKNNTIKLVHKENGGLVSAWMEGLKYVETTHICFIDSDDFIAPDYLECLLSELSEDIDMAAMQCMRYCDEANYYKFKINSLPAGTYEINEAMRSIILCDHGSETRPVAICRWGKIIRSDLVLRFAAYCTQKISYAEDQQLTVGILYACKKINIIDEYKYYYQFNPHSIINSYKKNMWRNVIILMHTIRRIPGIENVPDFELQFNTQYLMHMSECFRNEFIHRSFDQKFYNEVIDHEDIKNALNCYSTEKMRRFDKLICKYAKKHDFVRTKLWLKISEQILKLKA